MVDIDELARKAQERGIVEPDYQDAQDEPGCTVEALIYFYDHQIVEVEIYFDAEDAREAAASFWKVRGLSDENERERYYLRGGDEDVLCMTANIMD